MEKGWECAGLKYLPLNLRSSSWSFATNWTGTSSATWKRMTSVCTGTRLVLSFLWPSSSATLTRTSRETARSRSRSRFLLCLNILPKQTQIKLWEVDFNEWISTVTVFIFQTLFQLTAASRVSVCLLRAYSSPPPATWSLSDCRWVSGSFHSAI